MYEQEVSPSSARGQLRKYSTSSISQLNIVELITNRDRIEDRMNLEQRYFYPYPSRYSGGFNLLDTLKIPRACAYKSANLTEVDYYRGQNTMTYKIENENPEQAFIVTLMDENSEFIFQDGSPAADVGSYDQSSYSVLIQTDSEDLVGIQKTVIRNCDGLSRLLELNLYINVLSNSHPDFEDDIETSFTFDVGDDFTLKLPKVTDADGNDDPVVVIDLMEAQEDKFPPFLNFQNDTNTITMRPDAKEYSGRTYYFTIIVKEKNSDSVKYPYYCTVKMNGEIYEEDTSVNYTDINYTIIDINKDSKGALRFTKPVNFTWLEKNFYSMFKVFWRDTTYRTNKQNHTLEDFIIDTWGED